MRMDCVYVGGQARRPMCSVGGVRKLVDSTMTKGAAAWSMVGQPDVIPPDSLFASSSYKDEVPVAGCDDGYGNVTLVRHYKPDAVLAEMQSPLRNVVVLLDCLV